MGIACQSCGRIYLVTHPANAQRIVFPSKATISPSYRLTCDCSEVRFFNKRELAPTAFPPTSTDADTETEKSTSRYHPRLLSTIESPQPKR